MLRVYTQARPALAAGSQNLQDPRTCNLNEVYMPGAIIMIPNTDTLMLHLGLEGNLRKCQSPFLWQLVCGR